MKTVSKNNKEWIKTKFFLFNKLELFRVPSTGRRFPRGTSMMSSLKTPNVGWERSTTAKDGLRGRSCRLTWSSMTLRSIGYPNGYTNTITNSVKSLLTSRSERGRWELQFKYFATQKRTTRQMSFNHTWNTKAKKKNKSKRYQRTKYNYASNWPYWDTFCTLTYIFSKIQL